jgi:hypothetical protein
VILTLKSFIWWNLLEKREAFSYEKALKTDIYAVRLALRDRKRDKNPNGNGRVRYGTVLRINSVPLL